MNKIMAKMGVLLSLGLLVCTSLTGCGAKHPKIESATDLYDRYVQSPGFTNHKMHSENVISVNLESEDGMTINFPMIMTVDEQIAGNLKHIVMSVTYEDETGEAPESSSLEAYRTADGDYMQLSDGTWCLANEFRFFASDDGFIRDYVFKKGEVMTIEADDAVSYTVTIPMNAYTDSVTVQDMFYDIGLANMVDTVELTKALMGSSVIYTFDADFNLVSMKCEPVEAYAVYTEDTDEGTKSYNAKISYSFSYEFSDFGSVTDTEVTMPADCVIVTPDISIEEEPEAIDAAPSGADLPEH